MYSKSIKPKVSIIIPCYNQGIYLEECLQSVSKQSYNNWECIIINDGSIDNSEEVAIEWTKKDERFKYIFQQNKGVSTARNNAIDKAEGIYILPLDGDDKIGTKYLEFGVNAFLEDPSINLVYCNAEYFGNTKGPCELPPFDRRKILLENMILSCAMFKKEDWKSVGGYDIKMIKGYEDWEFWINLVLNINNFKVFKLDYVGFYYRRKEISRDVNISNDIKAAKKLVRYIERKHFKHYLSVFHIKFINKIKKLVK